MACLRYPEVYAVGRFHHSVFFSIPFSSFSFCIASAIQGDGTAYNKMDSTTANGADADEVACTILTSVAKGQTDFVVAASFSAKIALWLKFIAPNFLETMLVKRFEKGQIESKKTE